MNKKVLISTILISSITLFSFVAKDKIKISVPKEFKKKYALVPSGTVAVNGETVQVGDFFIYKTEISNADYNVFIDEVKAARNNSLLAIIQPQTQQWEDLCNNKALVTRYHTQKIYTDYPAVNISYEAAIEYCKWLTDKTNKEADNGLTYEFRLPTRAEWIRAAEGDLHNVAYAWGGPYARNSKGCYLCQCNGTTEHKKLFDMLTYTSPTVSYEPNSIGLYNMNGNAAEMTSVKGIAVGGSWASKESEVKNESIMTYETPTPMIGFRPVVIVKGN